VEINVAGDVTARASEAPASDASAPASDAALPPLRLPAVVPGKEWALAESAFKEGRVGAKALNLARLGESLPDWIQVRRFGGFWI
jgi:hypothetical protein